jgi:hypothetical protein
MFPGTAALLELAAVTVPEKVIVTVAAWAKDDVVITPSPIALICFHIISP